MRTPPLTGYAALTGGRFMLSSGDAVSCTWISTGCAILHGVMAGRRRCSLEKRMVTIWLGYPDGRTPPPRHEMKPTPISRYLSVGFGLEQVERAK